MKTFSDQGRIGRIKGSGPAAGEWTRGTFPFVVGLVVVALLVGAGWRSGKGRDRPPRPEGQPSRPASPTDTPSEEGRAADDFGAEGEALSPHEMKGYGNQGMPAPSDDNRGGGLGSGGLGS